MYWDYHLQMKSLVPVYGTGTRAKTLSKKQQLRGVPIDQHTRVSDGPGDAGGRAGSPGPGCLRQLPCPGEDSTLWSPAHQRLPVTTPFFPGVRSQALPRPWPAGGVAAMRPWRSRLRGPPGARPGPPLPVTGTASRRSAPPWAVAPGPPGPSSSARCPLRARIPSAPPEAPRSPSRPAPAPRAVRRRRRRSGWRPPGARQALGNPCRRDRAGTEGARSHPLLASRAPALTALRWRPWGQKIILHKYRLVCIDRRFKHYGFFFGVFFSVLKSLLSGQLSIFMGS